MKLVLLILPVILSAQLDYNGSIHPTGMLRSSDVSQISLPFRLVELKLGYTLGDFDLKTSNTLEYRWSTGKPEFDLREAYVIWYPSWGEVKLGKQIHAWGAVDGNNPTDNLNPYDYYYMFLPGSDRKIGVLSTSFKYYADWCTFEAVVIPQHSGNRIPFDEPDFPLSQATATLDPRDHIVEVENTFELGIKWQINLDGGDLSVSGLTTSDRILSLLAYDANRGGVIPHFGYRKTQVVGLDGVTFYRSITFRGEAAYFTTTNPDGKYTQPLASEAEYIQYALQAEFSAPFDIAVSSQLLGSEILQVDGATVNLATMTPTDLNEDNFSAGAGMPLAMIADRGFMLSLSRSFMDDILGLSGNTFYNLDTNSFMLGGKIDYSFSENLAVNFSFTQFSGNENEPKDRFNDLEIFSHVQVSLKYSF